MRCNHLFKTFKVLIGTSSTSARELPVRVTRGLRMSASSSQVKVVSVTCSRHRALWSRRMKPLPQGLFLPLRFASQSSRETEMLKKNHIPLLSSHCFLLGVMGGASSEPLWAVPGFSLHGQVRFSLDWRFIIVPVQLVPFKKIVLEAKKNLGFLILLLFVFWNTSNVTPCLARISWSFTNFGQ